MDDVLFGAIFGRSSKCNEPKNLPRDKEEEDEILPPFIFICYRLFELAVNK
jgi:hypothetical protein